MMSPCVFRGTHPVSRMSFSGEPTKTGMSVVRTRGVGRNVGGPPVRSKISSASLRTLTPEPLATLRLPGHAALDQREISAHHVGHVQVVADDVASDPE